MQNKIIWLFMLAVLAILAVQTRDNFDAIFAGVGTLDVKTDATRGIIEMRWRGRVDAPMAQSIRNAYEQHRDEGSTFSLSISSPGGSLDHGADVIAVLRAIGKTHRLETVVGVRDRCASMCVPIYLQGEKRTAAANARFMFHEVSFREFHSETAIKVPEGATERATDRFFERYFAPAGVSRSWIAGVRAAMGGGHDVWKTAAELIDEQAGIVQAID